MDTEDTPRVDLGALGTFDFTPDWAKKEAGVSMGKFSSAPAAAEHKDRRHGAGAREPRPDRGLRSQLPKSPRPDRGARPGGAALGQGHSRRADSARVRLLPLEVKVLPESKALGTVMRKVQQGFLAYKLKDLAYFLLDNPASVLLRLTPKAPAAGEAPLRLHQCRACGFIAMSEAEIVAHAIEAHLGDYYEKREVEVEPPKGNFNCVAKCGLSGELLGPPNIHDYNATVREMIRTRYPGMSEEEYRSHIVMVHDAEVIEQWRQSAVRRMVYVAKAAGPDAPELTRDQAEAEFRRLYLTTFLDQPKRALVPAEAALKSGDPALLRTVGEALERERRAPYEMCFALRGAFRSRKLNVFRVNDARGPEFVAKEEYKEFDAAHAIPELAKIAGFIAAHPCQPRAVIAPDAESEKQLLWLVSTNHVVAFSNGVFSAVEKYPKYGPQWQQKIAPATAMAPAAAPQPEEQAEKKEPEQNEASAQLAE